MDQNNNEAKQSAPAGEGVPKGSVAGDNSMIMGILSYLGPLVVVSYFVAKDNPFVKFHIKQGLVLLSIEVAAWIVGAVFSPLWVLYQLVNLAALVLSIIGIINVVQRKENELPFVGQFSSRFSI